ncbi:MAG: M28 family peptidase, partial [Gemmatimonadota bacterium]
MRYLSDDALAGRLAGSAGERCAGAYIAARFHALGLEPAGEGGYFQSLPLASAVNPHAPSGTGRNVVARLEGADPALRGEAVVIGAHYDHLGLGEIASLSGGEAGEVHNGADDNASGVAALLHAAGLLVRRERPARSVILVAFTGEELGLIGSGFYASHPAVPLERTVAMVNLDMVGRLEERSLIVYGVGTAPEWEGIVAESNRELEIPLAFEPAGYGPSDHTSFYAKGVPVLHLFTNVHGDYHKPTDDWDEIDAVGLARVGELTARIVLAVADRAARLTLVPGVGERDRRTAGYGAYLGTVPDFTPVERGVLLSGVTAGSPADEAGLRAGDVLVGLGEHDVEDLYAFTDA